MTSDANINDTDMNTSSSPSSSSLHPPPHHHDDNDSGLSLQQIDTHVDSADTPSVQQSEHCRQLMHLLQRIKSNLECRQCKSAFDSASHSPMLLPCRHSQCSQCCQGPDQSPGIEQQQQQQQVVAINEEDGVVHCEQHRVERRTALQRILYRRHEKYDGDRKSIELRAFPASSVEANKTIQSSLMVNTDALISQSSENGVLSGMVDGESSGSITLHSYISRCIDVAQHRVGAVIDELTECLCENAEEVFTGSIVCSICFSICDDVCALSCGHAFCRDCLVVHFTNHLSTPVKRHRWKASNCINIDDQDEFECPLCRKLFSGRSQILDSLFGVDLQMQDICDSLIQLRMLLDKWRRVSWIHGEQAILGQSSDDSPESICASPKSISSREGASSGILRIADGYIPFAPHRSEQDFYEQISTQLYRLFAKSILNAPTKKVQPEILSVRKHFVPFWFLRAKAVADTRIVLKDRSTNDRTVIQTQSIAVQRRVSRCAISVSELDWLPRHLRRSLKRLGPWPLSDSIRVIDEEFIRTHAHHVTPNVLPKYQSGQQLFDKNVKQVLTDHISKYSDMFKWQINSRVGQKHCPEEWERFIAPPPPVSIDMDSFFGEPIIEPGASMDMPIDIRDVTQGSTNQHRHATDQPARYITSVKTRIHMPEFVSSRLVLLPVIVARYRYEKHEHHFVLNGSNLEIMRGTAPRSMNRILASVIGGAALAGALAIAPGGVPMMLIGTAVGIHFGIADYHDKKRQKGNNYVI